MPVDLASIFNPAGYDMAAPALKAFGQMAELGLQRQKLSQDARFRLLDLDLRRQEMIVQDEGRDSLKLARDIANARNAEALGDLKIAQQEEKDFVTDKGQLFQPGVGSLFLRLNSNVPEVRNEAAEEYMALRDKYGGTKSRAVIRELEEMQQTMGAREREARMASNAERAALNADRVDADRDASREMAVERIGLAKDKFENQNKREKAQAEWQRSKAELANLQKNRALRAAELAAARKSFEKTERDRIPGLEEQIRVADEAIGEILKKKPAPDDTVSVPGMETGVGGSLEAASEATVLPMLPPLPPAPTGTKLTAEIAQEFLKQAGGDKEKARALARKAGYTF